MWRAKGSAPVKLSDFMLDFDTTQSLQDVKDVRKKQASDLLTWARILREQQHRESGKNG